MRHVFDPQAYAADALQRRWEYAGLTVTRARLADGTVLLAADERTALVTVEGSVSDSEVDDRWGRERHLGGNPPTAQEGGI